jgi:hypothetical protein
VSDRLQQQHLLSPLSVQLCSRWRERIIFGEHDSVNLKPPYSVSCALSWPGTRRQRHPSDAHSNVQWRMVKNFMQPHGRISAARRGVPRADSTGGCHSGDTHFPRGHAPEAQHIVGHQSASRPHFGREKVHGSRDSIYGSSFVPSGGGDGHSAKLISPHSPGRPYVERLIGSIRREISTG